MLEVFDANAGPNWDVAVSFYDIATLNLGPTRLLVKAPPRTSSASSWEPVAPEDVQEGKVVPTSFSFPSVGGTHTVQFYWAEGPSVTFRLDGRSRPVAVELGVRRAAAPRDVVIELENGPSIDIRLLEATKLDGVTQSVSLRDPCPHPAATLRIRSDDGAPLSVAQPIVRYALP